MTDAITDPTPSFLVKGQYIKDLSFENPHAPNSFNQSDSKPGIEVNVDLKAQALADDHYELILKLSARAIADNATMFLVELSYAGIFQIQNMPPERVEPTLLVDAPFLLFPFARRVIADVTRDGGFPPLMLEPIDFFGLYQQNRSRAA